MGWYRESDSLTDVDLKFLVVYLEKHYGLSNEKRIEDVIKVVANENRYHPVLDRINSITWDGRERIRYALHHFLGAEVSEYTYEVMKLFMIGTIARISCPGIKFEVMLCLVGGQVAMKTNFRGDNYCTVTACASATHAIGEAFRKIKDGYLDACLCGGTESSVDEFTIGGFKTMKALTKETDPAKASTPFDKNRSGFVLGEGCGVLLLEEYEHAVARGAKIYCELAGYGATCDAYHMTSPAPEGEAAAKAMVNAYTEAGLQPSDITYINAHGTSTGLNDKYETRAIKIALGEEAAKTVKINSTKSMTGHMLGGTGAVEAIVSAMSIHENFLHQTIGYTTPDPECDLDYCTEAPVECEVKAALSNSLGFGGHNATLCFKKCVD